MQILTASGDLRRQSLAGRRVFVTGASGFLGSHLIDRLIAEGAVVGGLARYRGRLASLPQESFYFQCCDLADAELVSSVIGSFEPEVLIHVAAHPDAAESRQQAGAAVKTNLIGTINVLEAFRLCGGSLFVYGDTSKVYGDAAVPYREATSSKPLSSYAIAKSAGWDFCKQYSRLHGVCCVSVRPTMIYGPRQAFNVITFVARSILAGASEVSLDGGAQTRDPLYVGDAVDAFIEVSRHGRDLSERIVNIGGGCERTVQEIAQMVATLMDSSVQIVCVAGRTRVTDMQRSYCDNEEAWSAIGWKPRIELGEGLSLTLAALTQDDLSTRASV